jgi:hypothetical protein
VSEEGNTRVLVDNRSDLPDALVEDAVLDYFVENASIIGQSVSSVQTYDGGTLMHRAKFKPPSSIQEEIKLARMFADTDDDVGTAISAALATAFGEGMENFNEDEQVVSIYNSCARAANLDGVLKDIYREYLIAGQFTTVCLYRRRSFDYQPEGSDGRAKRSFNVSCPAIGVLHSEHIVPLGNDLFHTAPLGYDPLDNHILRRWLEEFFGDKTTAARKAEMRRQDPVSAALYVEAVQFKDPNLIATMPSRPVYRLNPNMVARTTMPKGEALHPHPLMTRDFALLEAKRLLNLMDHALLQGGMNFIVVAKKGTDERPALPDEVQNLQEVVRKASRSGVIVGDHRLSFEIITPSLDALLSKDKRRLLGRKIAQAILRIPEWATEEAQSEGFKGELEFIARVLAADRQDVRRHVYEEIESRNGGVVKDSAKLWFPKIVLQGTQYFTDYVLKLRDRGDIPRRWAVEAGGFDYDAALSEREREVKRGDDDILQPAAVPFTNPAVGPQDNNQGRPSGTSPNNGAPGADRRTSTPPRGKLVSRNAGETVRAFWNEDEETSYRAGENTNRILNEYHDTAEVGRITAQERDLLDCELPTRVGSLSMIPVNGEHDVGEQRIVRLTQGASIVVGERRDGAVVAKALIFREPEFDRLAAEEIALRWGFSIDGWNDDQEEDEPPPAEVEETAVADQPGLTLVVNTGDRTAMRKIVHTDPATGRIVSVEDVPIEGGQ